MAAAILRPGYVHAFRPSTLFTGTPPLDIDWHVTRLLSAAITPMERRRTSARNPHPPLEVTLL